MEALFKQYYWVIKTLGLAAAVGLAASAITIQVGTSYALDLQGADADEAGGEDEDESDDEGERADNPFRSTRSKTRYGGGSLAATKTRVAEDINARNVFCPTCVPVVETASGEPLAGGILAGEIRSSLPLRLMATMEAEPVERSLAIIFDADTAVTGPYAVGDAVRPGVEIVSIDVGRLHLRNHAQLEYLELGAEVTGSAPTPSTRRKEPKDKPKRKPNRNAIPGAEDAISCANESSCTVDRAFVEKLMQNPAMLAKQARIVPSMRDGETQGFKFYGIRRGSLPKLLGLKNGDMLTEVNGEEIRSVDQAMGLAMKLRRASNLSVTLVRKGKPMTKEVQIQ